MKPIFGQVLLGAAIGALVVSALPRLLTYVRSIPAVATVLAYKAAAEAKAKRAAEKAAIDASDAEDAALALEAAKEIVSLKLKDPESARFRNVRHTEAGYRYFGRAICGEVNARNSYGGYTGFREFYAVVPSPIPPRAESGIFAGALEKQSMAMIYDGDMASWLRFTHGDCLSSTNARIRAAIEHLPTMEEAAEFLGGDADSWRRYDTIYRTLRSTPIDLASAKLNRSTDELRDFAKRNDIRIIEPRPEPAARAEPSPATTTTKPILETAPRAPVLARESKLSLRFAGESWIEIRKAGGEIIGSGFFASGKETYYTLQGKQQYELVIGNAKQVIVLLDDQVIDISPYIRVSVARFSIPLPN